MLKRIKTSLSHPKYVGLFFKDKFHNVILLIILFFAVFSASIFTKCMLTDQFGIDQAIAVEQMIQYSTDSLGNKPSVTIIYDADNKKFNGESMLFSSEDANISFLPTNVNVSQNKLCVSFFEDNYVIYYGLYKLGSYSYDNTDLKSFNISNVQKGDTSDCINFRNFLIYSFDKVQYQQATLISVQSIISTLVYYFILIVFCLIAAYLINPAIEFKIRLKLVLYDSLSYFYWYFIALLLSITWIEYIALLVPVIFTNITFAHIRRIK